MKKAEKTPVPGKNVPLDRSDISTGAQRLSTTKASMDAISASISQQEDIRIDKISEVKEKIRSGFYDSPDFIDKLAAKLLAEFGIKSPD